MKHLDSIDLGEIVYNLNIINDEQDAIVVDEFSTRTMPGKWAHTRIMRDAIQ